MTPIQQLYFVLRMKALKDPMIANLFQGIISWNDAAASAEEEAQLNEYLQTNDGATYLSAINAELNRFHLRNQEITTPPPSPILPPCTESLYNPNGVKTLIARNLPRDITNHELKSIFEKHGVICDIYIPLNKNQDSPYYGTVRGFATIKFLTSQESTRAFMAETSTLVIRNKKIAIEFAKEDHQIPPHLSGIHWRRPGGDQ
jgi:RNA recognition motif-containing protein